MLFVPASSRRPGAWPDWQRAGAGARAGVLRGGRAAGAARVVRRAAAAHGLAHCRAGRSVAALPRCTAAPNVKGQGSLLYTGSHNSNSAFLSCRFFYKSPHALGKSFFKASLY